VDGERGERRNPKLVRRFTTDYLRRDGLLVVRLIASNAGGLVAAEVLCGMWQIYGPETRGREGRMCLAGGEDENEHRTAGGKVGKSGQKKVRMRVSICMEFLVDLLLLEFNLKN